MLTLFVARGSSWT